MSGVNTQNRCNYKCYLRVSSFRGPGHGLRNLDFFYDTRPKEFTSYFSEEGKETCLETTFKL